MMTYANTQASGASGPLSPGPLYVNGTGFLTALWQPTAMDLDDNAAGSNTIASASARTASTCYMRGLKEIIRLSTSSGMPWMWRRITFTYRGEGLRAVHADDLPTIKFRTFQETSNGFVRVAFNAGVNNMGLTIGNWYDIIFKGKRGTDWIDEQIAPVDNTRISLKSDKKTLISSGNNNGVLREYKRWHGMNANLVYDDDEVGGKTVASFSSVANKAGMGDYYVLDLISPGAGATSTDIIKLDFESTLYWHEK